MKLLLLSLALLVGWVAPAKAAPPPAKVWDFLLPWEGYRTRPYADGPGWSVGLGHSLTANRERGIWSRPYTHAEISRLFYADLSWATDACRQGVRGWEHLPETAQLVSLSVTWTVGRTGLHHFASFRAALSARNWPAAARALQQSKWASDVGARRAGHHAALLLSLSRSHP